MAAIRMAARDRGTMAMLWGEGKKEQNHIHGSWPKPKRVARRVIPFRAKCQTDRHPANTTTVPCPLPNRLREPLEIQRVVNHYEKEPTRC